MTNSEIYRMAAKLVARSPRPGSIASCWAVDVAASGGNLKDAIQVAPVVRISTQSMQRYRYSDLFIPTTTGWVPLRWGDQWGENADDCRVLALLLMSEIAKDEERKA